MAMAEEQDPGNVKDARVFCQCERRWRHKHVPGSYSAQDHYKFAIYKVGEVRRSIQVH